MYLYVARSSIQPMRAYAGPVWWKPLVSEYNVWFGKIVTTAVQLEVKYNAMYSLLVYSGIVKVRGCSNHHKLQLVLLFAMHLGRNSDST
jgi:hypothetical protein